MLEKFSNLENTNLATWTDAMIEMDKDYLGDCQVAYMSSVAHYSNDVVDLPLLLGLLKQHDEVARINVLLTDPVGHDYELTWEVYTNGVDAKHYEMKLIAIYLDPSVSSHLLDKEMAK